MREHVVKSLLERMETISKQASIRQQALPVGLVITLLPPSQESCDALELPKTEDLQRGITLAKQAVQQAQQAYNQPAPSSGLFGNTSANAQQKTQTKQQLQAAQALYKVRTTGTAHLVRPQTVVRAHECPH